MTSLTISTSTLVSVPVCAHSPHCGNAVCERDYWNLCVTGLYSQRTRVCYLTRSHGPFIDPVGGCSEIGNSMEMLPGTSLPGTYHLLAAEALRLALMPTINQMRYVSSYPTHTFWLILRPFSSFTLVSVTGIVTIPAVMMHAILNGTDVEQAARLQIIIMFMISASNALSCIVATHLALMVCVDSEQHIRFDCIDTRPHWLCRTYSGTTEAIADIAGRAGIFAISSLRRIVPSIVQGVRQVRINNGGYDNPASERTRLLT
jgi:hypothetical protein